MAAWWVGTELNRHGLRRRVYSAVSPPMLSLPELEAGAGLAPTTFWL